MSIQAVIWDFGGVFTTSPFDAFNRYERERGLPNDIIRTINSKNPDTNAWAKIERSEIDAAMFDKLFEDEAKLLGHMIPGPTCSRCSRATCARAWSRRSSVQGDVQGRLHHQQRAHRQGRGHVVQCREG